MMSNIQIGAELIFFFSSRRRHTRSLRDWSSDVCSSDLLFVMMEMHTARDARLGLETRDIPRDEIAAPHWFFWTVNDLAERKDRRQDRRRGMTAEGIADIVEIERVRRGAVDQRGVERRRPPVAA